MAKRWTTYQISYLLENYKLLGNKEIADVIGRSPGAVKKYLQERGIKRTAKQLKVIRKRMCSIPNDGQFKKGTLPHNTKYNGHERITKDGYVEIRLSRGNYVLKHRYMWEKANGSLPKGYCLTCINGDKTNTSPGNWKLISRIENCLNNSRYRLPEELIPSTALLIQLNNKLKSLQNG